MNQYRIEDFTKRLDYSDVIAVVYYEKFRPVRLEIVNFSNELLIVKKVLDISDY